MKVARVIILFSHLMHAGEGVPDYATLYMNRNIKPLPFPEIFPQVTPFTVDPKTG